MIVCIPHAKLGYRQAIFKRKSPASKEDRAFLFGASDIELSSNDLRAREVDRRLHKPRECAVATAPHRALFGTS
jgi:hypothetical protein